MFVVLYKLNLKLKNQLFIVLHAFLILIKTLDFIEYVPYFFTNCQITFKAQLNYKRKVKACNNVSAATFNTYIII